MSGSVGALLPTVIGRGCRTLVPTPVPNSGAELRFWALLSTLVPDSSAGLRCQLRGWTKVQSSGSDSGH